MMVLYAMHDAMVKPMPGNAMAPSLAESWSVSKDGLTLRVRRPQGRGLPQRRSAHRRGREVQLRALPGRRRQAPQGAGHRSGGRRSLPGALPPEGAVAGFHDLLWLAGDGGGLDRAQEVRREGRRRRLQEGARSARAVPARVVQSGRRAGVRGARPLLAQGPGGQAPGVEGRDRGRDAARDAQARRGRRRVLAARPARRGGEAHGGPQARPHRDSPPPSGSTSARCSGTRNRPGTTGASGSPPRMAFDKNAINQAETLGFSRPTGSIIPSAFEYALAIPPYPYDSGAGEEAPGRGRLPERLRRGGLRVRLLLRERGRGHRNYLAAVGIRTKVRPMERAPSSRSGRTRRSRGILQAGAGGQGNAATRVQNYLVKDGLYAWGGYPDMDDLFVQQARELDPKRREMLLHQIQRLAHERVMAAPLWELGLPERGRTARGGVRPRAHRLSPVLRAVRGPEAPEVDDSARPPRATTTMM